MTQQLNTTQEKVIASNQINALSSTKEQKNNARRICAVLTLLGHYKAGEFKNRLDDDIIQQAFASVASDVEDLRRVFYVFTHKSNQIMPVVSDSFLKLNTQRLLKAKGTLDLLTRHLAANDPMNSDYDSLLQTEDAIANALETVRQDIAQFESDMAHCHANLENS